LRQRLIEFPHLSFLEFLCLAPQIDIPKPGPKPKSRRRPLFLGLAAASLLCAAFFTAAAARPDNPSEDTVGAIEGEAISVQGPMTVEVVAGKIKTVLRSGNDIRVKSGQAHIDLVEGGQISICGPAHLSVLKSGGSLTVALDSGVIHAHIEHSPALTVYTAQIQAKPIAIGDGPQDALIGFDSPGAMCVRATRGAVRLEQQLTGQNIIVPEGRDIVLNNGQLDGLRIGAGQCICDWQAAAANGAPSAPEYSRLATTEEIQQSATEAKKAPAPAEKAPAKEEPVYQVFMPPLAYDAKAKVQRDNFDPKLILLVRRVRVRPTLIFQGRVEGDPVVAKQTPAAKPAPAQHPPAPAPPADDSMVNRVRAFFHRIFS
jgi:hypothetical protein